MSITPNPKIEKIFAQSKLACFGRYVLRVPVASELVWGRDFPTLPNQAQNIKRIVEARVAEIKAQDKTAEINYAGPGPAPNVVWIRSYDDDTSKSLKLEGFDVYYLVGPHIFVGGDTVSPLDHRTYDQVKQYTIEVAQNLRLREPNEVPTDEGLCHEYGFTKRSGNKGGIAAVGLHMEALPDVVFSVWSNTGGSTQGENGWGLLQLVAKQRSELGSDYPKLKVLRERKRTVHGWDGEEFLTRREDGAHDFTWMFVGGKKNSAKNDDVARPVDLKVTMNSKVRYDRIGAADKSSLTDEEALALWDRLLESLKFRVAVPGAPDDAVEIKSTTP